MLKKWGNNNGFYDKSSLEIRHMTTGNNKICIVDEERRIHSKIITEFYPTCLVELSYVG